MKARLLSLSSCVLFAFVWQVSYSQNNLKDISEKNDVYTLEQHKIDSDQYMFLLGQYENYLADTDKYKIEFNELFKNSYSLKFIESVKQAYSDGFRVNMFTFSPEGILTLKENNKKLDMDHKPPVFNAIVYPRDLKQNKCVEYHFATGIWVVS